DYKDAWFCGFTGGLATVVWMGRDDATPMTRITGGSAPADLWRSFMLGALERLPNGPIPPGAPPPEPPSVGPNDALTPTVPLAPTTRLTGSAGFWRLSVAIPPWPR